MHSRSWLGPLRCAFPRWSSVFLPLNQWQRTPKSVIRELGENGTWQGASLIEPAAEPAHGLIPEEIGEQAKDAPFSLPRLHAFRR